MQQFSWWSSERNPRPFSTGGIPSYSTATCFLSREPFPFTGVYFLSREPFSECHSHPVWSESGSSQIQTSGAMAEHTFPSNGPLPSGGMQPCGPSFDSFPSTDNHYHFHLPAQAHPFGIEARHGIGCPVPAQGNHESHWTACQAGPVVKLVKVRFCCRETNGICFTYGAN